MKKAMLNVFMPLIIFLLDVLDFRFYESRLLKEKGGGFRLGPGSENKKFKGLFCQPIQSIVVKTIKGPISKDHKNYCS